MNLEKILASGILNRNELARRMYPSMGERVAGQYLYTKLNNKRRHSFTPADRKKMKEVLTQIFEDEN